MPIHIADDFILLQRIFIIFGSICLFWFIIGLIFLSLETYRHLQKHTNFKSFRYQHLLKLSSSFLLNHGSTFDDKSISDDDQNDDEPFIVCTSTSSVSKHTNSSRECQNSISSFVQLSEEQTKQTSIKRANISKSSLTTPNDQNTNILQYSASQNRTDIHSASYSLNDHCHDIISTLASKVPLKNCISSTSPSTLHRQLSQTSIVTNLSQITHITHLSSQPSIKTRPLPTVMITDVDRLHTDIIELDDFEPEKHSFDKKSQLIYLLDSRFYRPTK